MRRYKQDRCVKIDNTKMKSYMDSRKELNPKASMQKYGHKGMIAGRNYVDDRDPGVG